MKRTVMMALLVVALVAAAPIGAWAAGYETKSGSTSTTDSVSGVPVPGGGTRNTSASASESWSRSQQRYDAWERANMTASTAVNVVGAMQSIAGLLGGMSAGPVIATPTGVYAPNGGGYGGGGGGGGYDSRGNCVYGCGGGYGGQQVPPFVYQRPVPPVASCVQPGCWPQAAPVVVQVGPRCGYELRTDGRGLSWQEYVCR